MPNAWAFLEPGTQAADSPQPTAMSEEAKKDDDEVTIKDLKEVIDGQSHRIDALTSLVRAQQVTMDRLLRAVEKGAAIPAAAVPPPAPQAYAGATRQAYAPSTSSRTGPTGYGAAPQAYGPGSASDPSAARAREHAQRLEAERQRSEAARRAHAERPARARGAGSTGTGAPGPVKEGGRGARRGAAEGEGSISCKARRGS